MIIVTLILWHVLCFDKLLTGTDKMIAIQPPEGEHWVLTSGSIILGRVDPALTLNIWLEEAPYHPYRDPATGELEPSTRQVTLIRRRLQTEDDLFLNIIKENGGPIAVDWPNRLMIAVTPEHGGLSEPLPTWVRFGVQEMAP